MKGYLNHGKDLDLTFSVIPDMPKVPQRLVKNGIVSENPPPITITEREASEPPSRTNLRENLRSSHCKTGGLDYKANCQIVKCLTYIFPLPLLLFGRFLDSYIQRLA